MPTVRQNEVLDGIPLFESFSPAERAAMVDRGRIVDVPAGTILMREGEPADGLYVLIEGEVRALRRDPTGAEVEVGRRGIGDCFGEMALIDGGPRSATIEVVRPARVFVLETSVFLEVVAPSAPLLGKLLLELSRMLRQVSGRVVRDDLERRTRHAEAEVARHRAITQAVTGLAHELNTPLGVAITMASLIAAQAEGDERISEPAALLNENLARAADLVEAFTAIAALHSSEPLEDHDLGAVIEETWALFVMEKPAPVLDIRLPEGGPWPWTGYRGHLERVMRELFANAAAHAYPDVGGGPVSVAIAPVRLGGRSGWRITVADQGGGLAETTRDKAFDAFFTTARGRGHKGLGLTLVHNTVTGPLEGRIRLENAAGGGTVAIVEIPSAA